jgi:alkylation response protein AidB-like acyl-CoA dehydrogenase
VPVAGVVSRIWERAGVSEKGMSDPFDEARRLAAVAAEYADDGERERRLAPAVVDAFVASKLARLIAPTALGGRAAHPCMMVETVETVSAADASAGWCVGIGLGSNYLAGFLPECGARELFVDLDRPGAGVFAPMGRGVLTRHGFRLSGRWAFASGCQHSAVQACGMFAIDRDGDMERDANGAPIHRLAVVPSDALFIDETWDTVGLRGTGSHETEITDRVVPHEHTLQFGDRSWSDDAIYHQSPFAVLVPCLSAAALGVGRAALDLVEDQIRARHLSPRPGPKPPFGDDQLSQAELGRAEVRLRSVRSLLLDLLDGAYQSCLAGRRPTPSEVALLLLTGQEAMAAAVHAVDVACRLAGSSSVRDNSRLDRLQRDINTMRQHTIFSSALTAPLGRQLAGIPTIAWPFLLPTDQAAA